MPLYRNDDRLPAWGELQGFEIVRLVPGATHLFARRAPREKLFVGEGACLVVMGRGVRRARAGDVLDQAGDPAPFEVTRVDAPAVFVHAWGRWGDEVGASGVFSLDNSLTPRNAGDPAAYPRRTEFDRHYHDCDEYWILFAGSGLAVSEGAFYEVAAGDCVATPRGHHHDFPLVYETVRGVYLETTLAEPKRRGHLWEHTHGPARPREDWR